MRGARAILAVLMGAGLVAGIKLALMPGSWPESAYRSISQIERYRTKDGYGLSQRCYPGDHSGNLLTSLQNFGFYEDRLDLCFRTLRPVTGFIAVYEDELIERVFRGAIDGYICELTASAVRRPPRIVGSDCGLALFPDTLDAKIGELSSVRGG